jgi:AraC-like DNA-binding protein
MNPFDQAAPIFLLSEVEEVRLDSADALPRLWRRSDVMLWILTLQGSACYSQSGRPQFLMPGSVLVSMGPLNRSIKVIEKEGGWHCLYLAAENEMTKSRMEYVMRNFGSMTKTALDSPCVHLARRLASRRGRRDLWTRSGEAFRWFHAWWQESERHNLAIRHLLSSRAEPRECAPEIFSLKSLANQLGYSPSYLSRMLGKKWKQSPARSLREARLESAARELEQSDIQISALAAKLGYLSNSAFIRAFRKVHGVSPDRFRDRHRKVLKK